MTLLAAVLAALAAVTAVPAPRPLLPRTTGRDPSPARAPAGPPERAEPLRLVAVSVAAVAPLLLVPGTLGAALAAPIAAVVWVRSRRWESAAARRRRGELSAAVPHAVDLLVAALAAGAAPSEALERVARVVGGPFADEVRPALRRLHLGSDPVGVWATLARHHELGRLGTTLQRSAQSGAPVVDALGRLAEELRARRRSEVETRVRQVEVKASVPLAACLLPAFVLVGVVPLVAGAVNGFLLG